MTLPSRLSAARRFVRCCVAATLLLAAASPFARAGESTPQHNWPEFRGPYGNGLVTAPDDTKPVGLPTHWSETENVKWKTAIPFHGWSTPVTQGNDIWLTTATDDGHDFYAICVDALTGKIKYNEKLFHSDNPEPLGNNVNGYASPSPVIEPGRVYIHFGSYGTACLDTATHKVLWQRTDLPCRHYRGPGSSAFLHKNLLYLTFDGADQQYVAALDKMTGKTVWRTDRTTKWKDLQPDGKPIREGDLRKAFNTPIIVESGGKEQLISIGSYAAFAYDALDGKEIWTLHFDGYTPAPRALYRDGLVYIITGRGKIQLVAVRVDGHGDITDTHVAWKFEGPLIPQEPSPIIIGDLLYMVNNNGVVTCLEAATGNKVWSERIGGNFVASPIYADGHLYFDSTQGKTSVLKTGRNFEVLATNTLAGGFMASPAVSGKALILRTKTDLYRIEDK